MLQVTLCKYMSENVHQKQKAEFMIPVSFKVELKAEYMKKTRSFLLYMKCFNYINNHVV